MEDEVFNNQNNSEGNVPPPPENEGSTLRTMASDVDSVRKSGGGMPEAEPINPLADEDEGTPVFSPETTIFDMTKPPSVISTTQKPHEGVRMWLVWLLGVVIVVALLVALYVYAWPLIFPRTPELPTTETVQQNVEEVSPAVPAIVHQSALGYAPESPLVSQISVDNYNVVSIVSALQDASENIPSEGFLREILVLTSDGSPARFSDYLVALLPGLKDSALASLLASAYDHDFTAFLYYDDKGVWPGYIVRKTNTSIPVDLLALSEIEHAEIFNFFLTPPTGEVPVFKNGQISNRFNTRYAPLTKTPSAFNYGLFGDYLILSTSYQGLLKVIEMMKL